MESYFRKSKVVKLKKILLTNFSNFKTDNWIGSQRGRTWGLNDTHRQRLRVYLSSFIKNAWNYVHQYIYNDMIMACNANWLKLHRQGLVCLLAPTSGGRLDVLRSLS